jgi:cytochrome P450
VITFSDIKATVISGGKLPNTLKNARRHLAFGKGIHFYIGSALGKLEAELALEALTRAFPHLRLVPDQQVTFHPNISFRGPQALWVQAN